MTNTLQLCSLLALLQALGQRVARGDRKEQPSCSKGGQRYPQEKSLASK